MRIEHVALNVPDPAAMAGWYVEHLGFRVVRSSDEPVVCRFLADDGGGMLEIYRNTAAPVPDYASSDPLVMHIAMEADDVPATHDRLVAAGAASVQPPHKLPTGDDMAMLRDPWGVALQLIRRAEPMR